MGISVRREHLGGAGGGLCTIRGARVVFDDLDADPATRLQHAAQAIAALPEAESIYISPAVRALIETAIDDE